MERGEINPRGTRSKPYEAFRIGSARDNRSLGGEIDTLVSSDRGAAVRMTLEQGGSPTILDESWAVGPLSPSRALRSVAP